MYAADAPLEVIHLHESPLCATLYAYFKVFYCVVKLEVAVVEGDNFGKFSAVPNNYDSRAGS